MKMKNSFLNVLFIGIVLILGVLIAREFTNSSAKSDSAASRISMRTEPNEPTLGANTFIITVKDTNGKPVRNATVFFDLNMTAMNMGTQNGNATPQGDGTYAATGRLTMRGSWKVSTRVTIPGEAEMNKDFDIVVQ